MRPVLVLYVFIYLFVYAGSKLFVNFREKVHAVITGESPVQICTIFG